MEMVEKEIVNSSDPPRLGGNDVLPRPLVGVDSPSTVGMETEDDSAENRRRAVSRLFGDPISPIKSKSCIEVLLSEKDSMEPEYYSSFRILSRQMHPEEAGDAVVVLDYGNSPELDLTRLIRKDLSDDLHKSLHLSHAAIEKRWGADLDKIAKNIVKNDPMLVADYHYYLEYLKLAEVTADRLRRNRVHHLNSLIGSSSNGARSHLFTSNHRETALDNVLNSPLYSVDIPDGNHDQRGKSVMLDDSSHTANYQQASSSSSYELNSDGWAHTTMKAQDHFNPQRTSNGADATNDDDRASPVKPDAGSHKNKIQFEMNDIIIAISGQAAFTLIASSSSGSPFLHSCVAAIGVGFLGSLFAKYYAEKKPKIARILSRFGAAGAAFAVIIALAMHFPKDTKWHLDVVATAIACLITAFVVATS